MHVHETDTMIRGRIWLAALQSFILSLSLCSLSLSLHFGARELMDSAFAVGFRSSGYRYLSAKLGCVRRRPTNSSSRRVSRRDFLLGRGWNVDGCCSSYSSSLSRSCLLSAKVRSMAMQEDASPLPDSPKSGSWKQCYHPSEEIEEPLFLQDGQDVRLTDAETARTIIEVHSKATLMFSGIIDDQIHENIIWPDMPYLTDEHGDIYFEVNAEEILQTLIADDKLVQVIIGVDNIEMLSEMEVLSPNLNFELEDISSEGSDMESDYDEEDIVSILEDVDEILSSEDIDDWTNLETMQSCHPMHFANKMTEVVSNINLDWMDQPPASIIMQGHLRPAFFEENAKEKKLPQASLGDVIHSGATFYKLEMINIQMVSAYGNQSAVKIQDFRKAQPDIIAHSAANIISRLKAGGEKILQALKMLCLRQRGIQVEEAIIIGVDSLGFDLRICSGTQVQTLRFAFNTRATSEISAEKKIYDILFPSLNRRNRHGSEAHTPKD